MKPRMYVLFTFEVRKIIKNKTLIIKEKKYVLGCHLSTSRQHPSILRETFHHRNKISLLFERLKISEISYHILF